MPTYEYQCLKCKKPFEIFQSMKDEPLQTCPKEQCQMKTWGKGKVKRQLGTGAGLIFKGSGFYITDYRSEGYKASAKQEKTSNAAPAAKPDTAAKPETKSETKKTESKPPASGKKSSSAKKE